MPARSQAGGGAAPRDEAIARGIRRGEAGAFDDLFNDYGGPLLGYLTGMVGDASGAEDLVQETMLRVYRSIDRYQERGTFRAWVFRIATNLALTQLRRRRYAIADPLDDGTLQVPDPDAPDPLEALEARERERMMEAALATLADDHRAVILLRIRQGMGIREMARTLCVPEGTIKSRIHHAVLRMREYVNRRECSPAKEGRHEDL
jgi:RNA polymerase sigma-70 factor, ECF subfamily